MGSRGIRGTVEGQLLIQKESQSLSLHLNEPYHATLKAINISIQP